MATIDLKKLSLPPKTPSRFAGMVNTGVYQKPQTTAQKLNLKTPDEIRQENALKAQQKYGVRDNTGAPVAPVAPATPPINVSASLSTSQLGKATTAPTITDSSGLIKNIQATYDKYGGQAGANEAFVRGAIKASGQAETPELIAQYSGKKLGDVISGLKLGEKITGFGVTPPIIAPEATKSPTSTVDPVASETVKPKTAFEEMEAFVNDYSKNAEQKMAELGEQQGLETKSQEITQAEQNLSTIDNQIEAYNLDLLSQSEDIKNKPILLGDISQKLSALDNKSKINLMLLNSNRNKALADYNSKVGDYTRASEIVKETANDWKETQKMKLDLYAEKINMQADEKQELSDKNDKDFAKLEKGYIQITPELEKKYEQDILSGKADGTIITDVYGQKWFKPKSSTAEEQNYLLSLMEKYPDSGITLNDDTTKAQEKLKTSKLYLNSVRLLGSGVGSGNNGGGGKVVSSLAQAVLSGTMRLEDLTPTMRGSIAQELIDAGYKTPSKLSAGQQDDIATMNTVSGLINQVIAFNNDGKLEGIGAFGQGTLSSVLAQAGFGSEEGKTVRTLIGNIRGTIAKLRGGTSFTANEERLLNTYTPGINDNPSVAINKLVNLKNYIAQKNEDLLKTAQAGQTVSKPAGGVEDIKSKYKLNY